MLSDNFDGYRNEHERRPHTSASTTTSYGEIQRILESSSDIAESPISFSSTNTGAHTLSSASSRRSTGSAPQRTLDSVREQVAEGLALRGSRAAEVIDGCKVGVIHTLVSSEVPFLVRIASNLRRQLATSTFIFAITSDGTPAPVLLAGSSEDLVARAAMLLEGKFLGRLVPGHRAVGDTRRWLAHVDDLRAASPFDGAALHDVVAKAARYAEPITPLLPPPESQGIAARLASVRAKLERVTARTAYEELRTPSSPWPIVLVDIRPEAQRRVEGTIAGAMCVERAELEWCFDPRETRTRLPVADRYDLRVILLCHDGDASSLAAASLRELGLLLATDVIGGFKAWREAGLPNQVQLPAVQVGLPASEEDW